MEMFTNVWEIISSPRFSLEGAPAKRARFHLAVPLVDTFPVELMVAWQDAQHAVLRERLEANATLLAFISNLLEFTRRAVLYLLRFRALWPASRARLHWHTRHTRHPCSV